MMMNRAIRLARETASTVLLVLIVFGLSHLLVRTVEVQGRSMLPTLHNGELILVDTLSYRLHPPQRGDIIILHPPVAPNDNYVKRVIGLPGDRIKVLRGTVYVNGAPLPEPYLHLSHTYNWPETGGFEQVPRGDLFVLGDNRDESYDSHLWEPTPFLAENEVVGRAMLAYWPLPQVQIFPTPAYAGVK